MTSIAVHEGDGKDPSAFAVDSVTGIRTAADRQAGRMTRPAGSPLVKTGSMQQQPHAGCCHPYSSGRSSSRILPSNPFGKMPASLISIL